MPEVEGTPDNTPTTALGSAATEPVTDTSWRDALPEDLRDHASLGPIETLGGLAKSYISAQQMIGADKIVAPNQHTTEEQWGTIYNKLGRPETADKYEFDAGDGADENFITALKQEAHKNGLSNKQLAGMTAWLNKNVSERTQAEQTRTTEETTGRLNAFKQTLGDNYDSFLDVGATAMVELEKKENFKGLTQFMDDTGVGDHPMMLKLMNFIGQQYMEDEVKKSGNITGFTYKSMDDITEEISQLRANPAWLDKMNPEHKAVVNKLEKLHQLKARGGGNAALGGRGVA